MHHWAYHHITPSSSLNTPLLQSIIQEGVVGAEDKDGIEPVPGEEVATVVLNNVPALLHGLLQFTDHLHMKRGTSIYHLRFAEVDTRIDVKCREFTSSDFGSDMRKDMLQMHC